MLRLNRYEMRCYHIPSCRVSFERCFSLASKNHYEVLGISQSATRAEVKKAYIEKAKKCHPDLFPDNEEKTKEFQELQEAYSVLSDTKTRAAYSQSNQPYSQTRQPDPFRQYNSHGYSRQSYPNKSSMNDPLHDMFKDFNRQHWHRRSPFTEEEFADVQEKKKKWERILVIALFLYFLSIIVVNNFRLSSARKNLPDPQSQEDQFHAMKVQAEHMMSPREREALARQRETKGFIEMYYRNMKEKESLSKETPVTAASSKE